MTQHEHKGDKSVHVKMAHFGVKVMRKDYLKKHGAFNLKWVKELEAMPMFKDAETPKKDWAKWKNQCDVQDIIIPGGDAQDMRVQVIKTKKDKDTKGMPACIQLHGGGAILMPHLISTDYCCRLAVNLDCVMINVEFRNAPVKRTPGAFEDTVASIKYFHENAEKYGIDKDQISM